MVAITRRRFIESLGVALASLAMAHCVPFKAGGGTPRECLRRCWTRFDWLAERVRDWDRQEGGDEARKQLVADHQTALDELVAAGEIGAGVASQVQAAFEAAVFHIWRSYGPATCYEAIYPDYAPRGRGQLIRQAELLVEMAEVGDLDPDVIAQAQAAIERDVTFLLLDDQERQALYEELREAAGGEFDFPSFDELDLEITPEAAEAARFLVELLLEE